MIYLRVSMVFCTNIVQKYKQLDVTAAENEIGNTSIGVTILFTVLRNGSQKINFSLETQ